MNTSMARVQRDLREVSASISEWSAPPIFAMPVSDSLEHVRCLVSIAAAPTSLSLSLCVRAILTSSFMRACLR